jgi:uncharacterized repeat protein (TIGR01451 family)
MVDTAHRVPVPLAALLTVVALLAALTPVGRAFAADLGDADLSLSMSGANAAYAGQPFGFGFGVGNSGPADATGVVVTLVFPDGLSPVDTTPCAPVQTGLACAYPISSIPAGHGVSDPMFLVASAAGDYAVTGSVTADQPDPAPADNSAAAQVTVAPGVDLAVGIAESADPVRPNDSLTYTVTVTNNGPSTATAVTVTDVWSSTTSGGVTVRSIVTDTGACTRTTSGVDCALGDLVNGAVATITVTLRAKGTGTVTDQAQASCAEHEIDPSDNMVTEATAVSRR